MECLFRALDDYDITIDPMKNGIICKSIITNEIANYISHLYNLTINSEKFRNLCNILKPIDIKELFDETDLLKSIIPIALYEAKEKQKKLENDLEEILNEDKTISYSAYNRLYNRLSSVNQHIQNGSRINTEWISFSNNIGNILNYYLNQNIHQVAVIISNIVGFLDDYNCNDTNHNLLAYNLSSREEINANDFLIRKDKYNNYVETNKKFHGFNYAIHSKEFIYYNYIPNKKIVALLTPFDIDLLFNNVFDITILDSRYETQKIFHKKYLYLLKKHLQELNVLNDQMNCIIEEHYGNYKSIASLSNSNNEYKQLLSAKRNILQYIDKINDCPLVTGKITGKINMPETQLIK